MEEDIVPQRIQMDDFDLMEDEHIDLNRNLFLVFVKPIGVNSEGLNEYDFYFSKTPEIVWGEDWNEQCPSACEFTDPDPDTYNEIKRVVTEVEFNCAQNQSSCSLQDCIDGCIAISYENISNYDTYPEPYRLVFPFGMPYPELRAKLMGRDIILD